MYQLPVLVLLCFAALQCRSEAKQTEGSAGPVAKVVALVGSATASSAERGERALAIDSPMYRDDRLITSAGTELQILLEHNSAVWTLRGAKNVLLKDSAVWRAKGASAGLFEGAAADTTGAAGRHGEKQAADDQSSIMADEPRNEVQPEPETLAEAVRDGEGPLSGATDDSPSDGDAPADTIGGERPEPLEIKADGNSQSGKGRDQGKNKDKGKGSGKGSGQGSGGHSIGGLMSNDEVGGGFGLAGRRRLAVALSIDSLVGALPKAVLSRVFRKQQPAFRACAAAGAKPESYKVSFILGTDGKVQSTSLKVSGGASNEARACIQKAMLRLQAPASEAPNQVRATLKI